MAEKDKDYLVKEAEWKKTVAALMDELASVRVADGLAIEGFQMQKQVLEGELKRLKNSSEPVVERLKEKVAKLEEELSAKEWLQKQYNAISDYIREKEESWRVAQAEATKAFESLDDEINKLKFALERKDASSKIAHVELSQAKKDLRLLQLETDNDMALSGSSRS
ncbi:hypothetical protein R1sor_020134 [Riccia sorocarpa]|uniref:Uncharacterized protein n=1 Tax=Riccia sorocarpa TaxID=122646 RepID=A0ABD3IH87_9MARC